MKSNTILEKTIDSLIGFLKNDVLREKIQLMILEPLLQYSMERLFPYLLLLCAIVISMILLKSSMLSNTPPKMDNAPPLNPVRAPAGVTHILVELQYERIFEISCTVLGFITTSGGKDKSSVSSCEYWCNISESS